MAEIDKFSDFHQAWWCEDVQRQRDNLAHHAGHLEAFLPPRPVDHQTGGANYPRVEPITDILRRISEEEFNCFTTILKNRVAKPNGASGVGTSSMLSGRAFAVKDLFDVKGLPTIAGAASRQNAVPAERDAVIIERLEDAGAVLVGKCNMDEFAYGFATVNAHFGTTRNPHDIKRLAGGSSGGSAAAVAAGLVPLALGSDTNGSIRIPAALCGVYGLRPTHGDLPMDGVYPFVEFLDVPGPLAASVGDLRAAYEAMANRRLPPARIDRLRIARLDGWFQRNLDPELAIGLEAIAQHLDQTGTRTWPEAECARSAAFVLTAAEGGGRHLPALLADPRSFDPATRDRFLAGAIMPASAVIAAQQFRDWFTEAMRRFWDEVDVVLAPTTPSVAPRIDEEMIVIDNQSVSTRANLGVFTQPVSLGSCPVLAAPLNRPGKLPLGIQLIAAPGREDRLFAVAERLEANALIGFSEPGVTS